MSNEYVGILVVLLVGLLIGCAMSGLSYLFGRVDVEGEKLSSFECGFDALGNSRERSEIRFYLVGLLFIVFDVEASLLLPFVGVTDYIGSVGYIGMLDLVVELILGCVYMKMLVDMKSI